LTQIFGGKMEIKVLPLGDIQVNCYLVSTEKSALVVDPGFYSQKVEEFLKENSHKERMILLTHAHFDHIGGAELLRENTGVNIAIGEKENAFLSDPAVNLSGLLSAPLKPFSADISLKDNETLNIGDLKIKVIHTPGHTSGSVSYLIDDVLFSGDTLFNSSIGRTDFPTGDFAVLSQSIKKLYELDGEITVLSGHGEATNLNYEKMYNPFVRQE